MKLISTTTNNRKNKIKTKTKQKQNKKSRIVDAELSENEWNKGLQQIAV